LKNLITRTLTGIIFVAVIIGSVCIHPYGFLVSFTLIAGLALWEFYGFMKHEKWHRAVSIAGGMYLFAASFFYAGGYASGAVYLPYLFFLLFLLVAGLYRKTANPVHDWAMELFAQFYCAGLLSLLNFIAFEPPALYYMSHYVMLIFVFVWLNDTGAYLIGSAFGKHRMCPRISPLKSWEGFLGGGAVALLSSLLFARFFPQIMEAWYHWPALAAVVVMFDTWGDLVESLMKRSFGVKDSGTLLPGHGGVLDRLDSVILAAPAVYLYLEIFIRN
jgi:phosphatidate cytidylyltransferase